MKKFHWKFYLDLYSDLRENGRKCRDNIIILYYIINY